MSFNERLKNVQSLLKQQQLDGWLLYDFRRSNSLACEFLEIPPTTFLTRRLGYWIPQQGIPVKIVSIIEPHHLDHLPGRAIVYRSWQEFEGALQQILTGCRRIAMEYSPRNAVPYLSKVDAGTVDLVRECGVTVASSAELLQLTTGVWSEEQLQSHLQAAETLDQIAEMTWEWIATNIKKKQPITEYHVQQWMLEQMEIRGFMTEGDPICAVNAHSADPHYAPTEKNSSTIRDGDWILIDLWCKSKAPAAVYADITRVGVVGRQPSDQEQDVFQIVRNAQRAATDFVQVRFKNKQAVLGWEVDRAARQMIEEAGYGQFFTHRTGHNIGIQDHGNGTHMDDLETHDSRQVLPGTCFSIEPGIYLPGEFGVRLEYDLYVTPDGKVLTTGGIQNSIKTL